ncbi:MAG: ABC transporter permease [Pirellulales bacterium]|nr:ABC transporter permease [Pirellulales bacterium]
MSFWKIAWRNIQQRALASSLTGLSMALGVAAMIAVLVIHGVSVRQFEQDAEGYHLIVGAKGGKLQLVLNTVFHLSEPIENIPYAYYKDFVDGRFADFTEVAVPYCLGDSYTTDTDSFRIVGTHPDLFDKLPYGNHPDGSSKYYTFQNGGRNFHPDAFFEAVLGSVVARRGGLRVGDRFHATHGLGGEDVHDQNAFTVVGILNPTGTANDRALFVNMEGFYLLGNHELSHEQATQRRQVMATEHGAHLEHHTDTDLDTSAGHDVDAEDGTVTEQSSDHENGTGVEQDANAKQNEEPAAGSALVASAPNPGQRQSLPEDLREVTSVLVRLADDMYLGHVKDTINEGQVAQAVAPTYEITTLLDRIVGPIHAVLLVLTILIVLVAGISILVSIYNSMNERSHDIAVMRALGASRWAVMAIVLFESILLSVSSGLAGIVLGHALIAIAGPHVEARTGVVLHFFQFDTWELVVIPSLIALASLVGLLPAITAYRTDVAKSLGNS